MAKISIRLPHLNIRCMLIYTLLNHIAMIIIMNSFCHSNNYTEIRSSILRLQIYPHWKSELRLQNHEEYLSLFTYNL